jgi:hypothetical protein
MKMSFLKTTRKYKNGRLEKINADHETRQHQTKSTWLL